MQMSMRNGVTPKLKLTLTLTLTDTEDACPDPKMLGHRSITWQQHHNCRIVCELSLRILICILPPKIFRDIAPAFGFMVQTDRQTDRHTEADERYTHTTTVGVSN